MKYRLNFRILLLGALCVVLVTTYNNCSNFETSQSMTDLTSKVSCGQDFAALFQKTYHPFLKQNCVACHDVNGSGKGNFAANDVASAFSAFSEATMEKVSEYAISTDHNPPYTGPQHTVAINSLKAEWKTGTDTLISCGEQGSNTVGIIDIAALANRLETSDKVINAVANQEKTITWNLNTEFPGKNYGTATIEVKVGIHVTSTGVQAYKISQPVIRNASVDLHISSLLVKINSRHFLAGTTFYYAEADVYKTFDKSISGGTMLIPPPIAATDTIGLSIGSIGVVNLGPKPEEPVLFLAEATKTVTEGEFELEVKLSKASTLAVTVDISSSTNGLTFPANMMYNMDGRSQYNWDFDITETKIVFVPGEVSKKFKVYVSPDERYEENEQFRVSLGTPSGAELRTTDATRPKDVVVTITDNDTYYTGNTPNGPTKTYAQLMSGILVPRCVECHNNKKKDGNYDIANFAEITSAARRIAVPGQPNQSLMYMRVDAGNPVNNTLGAMPNTSGLSAPEMAEIYLWLLDGARNNGNEKAQ